MNRRNFLKSLVSFLTIAALPVQFAVKRLPKTWHLRPGDNLTKTIEMAEPGDTIYFDVTDYTIQGDNPLKE